MPIHATKKPTELQSPPCSPVPRNTSREAFIHKYSNTEYTNAPVSDANSIFWQNPSTHYHDITRTGSGGLASQIRFKVPQPRIQRTSGMATQNAPAESEVSEKKKTQLKQL